MTIVKTTGDLTPVEVDQLAADEAIIEAGITVFYKVGMALCRIRDQRTYRATHPTFEAYVADRWGMSRTRAYQLIESGIVADAMSTIVDTPLIENEAQARALAPIVKDSGPEAAAQVLTEVAAEAGRVTAQAIKTKVKTRVEPTPAVEPAERITVTVLSEPAPEPVKVKVHLVADDDPPSADQIRAMPLSEALDLEEDWDARQSLEDDARHALDGRTDPLLALVFALADLHKITHDEVREILSAGVTFDAVVVESAIATLTLIAENARKGEPQ